MKKKQTIRQIELSPIEKFVVYESDYSYTVKSRVAETWTLEEARAIAKTLDYPTIALMQITFTIQQDGGAE